MNLTFDISARTFDVTLDDGSLKLQQLVSETDGGRLPVECWDLYLGARVNLLGKPTTLMQANGSTVSWLSFYADQLRKLKTETEKCIIKYSARGLPVALTFEKGFRMGTMRVNRITPGGTSLRSMIELNI